MKTIPLTQIQGPHPNLRNTQISCEHGDVDGNGDGDGDGDEFM